MSLIEMRVPTIGESITEVTLSQWLKENGSYVEQDEYICEFESDKATLEFPAEASGKLIYVAAEDDDLEIGALVAKIDTSVTKSESAPAPTPDNLKESEKETVADEGAYAKGHPSPAAAKILAEAGVSPENIKGSGKGGRITKDDAQKAVEKAKTPPVETPEKSIPKTKSEQPAPVSTGSFSRTNHREKMSRMRRTIASRLVSAKNETAMLTTFNEIDLSAVLAMRKKYQEAFVEKYGIKLGFMSLFAKACAKVLMEIPDVNAILDGNELIYNDYVDISIAISTPTGLVVPPVFNVESLSFAEIEYKIKALAEKARNGSLTLEEMTGGTFTITNGGVFGSLLSTPIINQPQSAILGMHNIVQRPVAVNGSVEIRPMMYVALSYDHRVIDGKSSVTFLVKVKELLEDPLKFFLDL